MADKHRGDEPQFKNPETVLRRAWIERALAGVRARLDRDADILPAPSAGDDSSGAEDDAGADGAPRLYVVRNDRAR